MKSKFLLSALLLSVTTFSLQAQIKKGSIFTGGSFIFSSEKNETEVQVQKIKQTYLDIKPVVGWAISDNNIIGIELILSRDKYSRENYSEKGYTNGGGIFYRKYAPVLKNLYIFGQGNATISQYETERRNPILNEFLGKIEGWRYELSFSPGVSYQVTKNLHLETGFNNFLFANYISQHEDINNGGNSERIKKRAFSTGAIFTNEAELSIGFRLLIR